MPTDLAVDHMQDVRAWLRTHPLLTPLIAGRVFFRLPPTPAWPCIRFYRAGGGVQPGEVPLSDIRLGVDVWGSGDNAYQQVCAVSGAIEQLAHTATAGRIGSGATFLCNADVTGVIDAPDPDSGQPRRVLDLVLTLRAAGTADPPL